MHRLTDDNNAFAFAFFYRQLLQSEDGNLFFSPYSLSAALAMTYAGAAGNTAEQMAQTLHFELRPTRLHSDFNDLALELSGITNDAESPELNIANALWARQGYHFLPQFLDTLARQYGAEFGQMDFTQPEAAANRINQWASDHTAGKIPSVVNPNNLGPLTRLVIANAIYFKGLWEEDYDFDESDTWDENFYLADGSSISVPMMRQSREFQYHETENHQAVELPYQGDRLTMLVLLPKPNRANEFAFYLDADTATDFDQFARSRTVDLSMPRFKMEKRVDAKDLLMAMGMTHAFSPDEGVADFSGMADFNYPQSPDVGIYIGDVFQKAVVEVNEKGTEAAAVTLLTPMAPTSAPPTSPVVMEVNRPFIFLIRDNETGAILFIGRVANPTLED